MIDDDDPLPDMDEWMELSDAEADAIWKREAAKYNKWWNSLSVAEQQRIRIQSTLRCAVKWRRLRRQLDVEIATEYLKKSQMRLLKLRAWRQTGIYPGEA